MFGPVLILIAIAGIVVALLTLHRNPRTSVLALIGFGAWLLAGVLDMLGLWIGDYLDLATHNELPVVPLLDAAGSVPATAGLVLLIFAFVSRRRTAPPTGPVPAGQPGGPR